MLSISLPARRLICASAILTISAACGPTQAEYDAQLANYEKLSQLYNDEKEAHEKAVSDLAAVRARLEEGIAELKAMGVNVQSLEERLNNESLAGEQLKADLNQTQLALVEYRKRAEQLEKIRERFEALRSKLDAFTTLGLKVSVRHNRMVISLPGDVLFDSGKDVLKSGADDVLLKVAAIIRKDPHLLAKHYQVAGHSDNEPVTNPKYGDNWGLSAIRARSVLLFLATPNEGKKPGGGLDIKNLHIGGYGDSDPLQSNDTEEGRNANRRVELVIIPDVEEMLDLRSLL